LEEVALIYDKIRAASKVLPGYNDKEMADAFNDHLKSVIEELSKNVKNNQSNTYYQKLAVQQAKVQLSVLINQKFLSLLQDKEVNQIAESIFIMHEQLF